MDKEIDILDFACHHYGCVIRTCGKFRCTFYDNDITMNMYNSGRFIVFTYTLSDEELRERIKEIFGVYYKSAKISNMAIRFKHATNHIILEELEKRLKYRSLDDMFMKKEHTDSEKCIQEYGMTKCKIFSYKLEKQQFSSLRMKVWEDKKIKVMVFGTGRVNCSGIKSEEDKQLIIGFLRESLFPVMDECTVSDDDLNINFDDLL
jgi:TATA-box binding protein (TBP) (component of TFIID and TFIIIB)